MSARAGTYDRNDRFDTPTLIEVWRTAPYLHDGRYATIKELFSKGRHGSTAPAAAPGPSRKSTTWWRLCSSL